MTTNVVVDVPPAAAATAPLVVLLHGTGGDINDMADPAAHPGMNFERVAELAIRNRGWRAYPNVGFWSIGLDPTVAVEGWAPALLRRGFPVLNYSQIDPRGRLPRTAAELTAVLMALEDQRTGAADLPALEDVKDRSIVLLGTQQRRCSGPPGPSRPPGCRSTCALTHHDLHHASRPQPGLDAGEHGDRDQRCRLGVAQHHLEHPERSDRRHDPSSGLRPRAHTERGQRPGIHRLRRWLPDSALRWRPPSRSPASPTSRSAEPGL